MAARARGHAAPRRAAGHVPGPLGAHQHGLHVRQARPRALPGGHRRARKRARRLLPGPRLGAPGPPAGGGPEGRPPALCRAPRGHLCKEPVVLRGRGVRPGLLLPHAPREAPPGHGHQLPPGWVRNPRHPVRICAPVLKVHAWPGPPRVGCRPGGAVGGGLGGRAGHGTRVWSPRCPQSPRALTPNPPLPPPRPFASAHLTPECSWNDTSFGRHLMAKLHAYVAESARVVRAAAARGDAAVVAPGDALVCMRVTARAEDCIFQHAATYGVGRDWFGPHGYDREWLRQHPFGVATNPLRRTPTTKRKEAQACAHIWGRASRPPREAPAG
mmetsp:Transcript_2586/g.8547  ORF Transcript_2586/g.8547 Transcript_2586/m.8547 type:complete len:328 (+) Transcript_2586:459-1442(+)